MEELFQATQRVALQLHNRLDRLTNGHETMNEQLQSTYAFFPLLHILPFGSRFLSHIPGYSLLYLLTPFSPPSCSTSVFIYLSPLFHFHSSSLFFYIYIRLCHCRLMPHIRAFDSVCMASIKEIPSFVECG